MKKIYNPTTVNETMEDVNKMRLLYRAVNDLAKKLELEKNQWKKVADMFTSSQELLRMNLRDYCEKLIYQDFLGHGRKVEELLWRKGFYEVVCAAKKLKNFNTWSNVEKAMVSSHLLAGIGFYNQLILGLQLEYNLDIIDAPDIQYTIKQSGLINNTTPKLSGKYSKECQNAVIRFIHRSLICIGDLARYRVDLDPLWIHWLMAVRYYKLANSIDHTIGMPYNQLGTVSGSLNYGLDATYHYLRCMLCIEKFEGAESNLKRIVKIHAYTGNETDNLHRCISRLLSLLELWDSEVPDNEKINQDSQALLNDIQSCLMMKPNPESLESQPVTFFKQIKTSKPENLTDDMMLKIVSICLMFISKLQSKDLSQVQGATAFTLALLSQLVHFVTVKIQKSFIAVSSLTEKDFQFENEQDPLELAVEDKPATNDTQNSANSKSKRYSARHKNRSLLTKLRRSRRRMNSSDSDASEAENYGEVPFSDDDLNSDISETEDGVNFNGMSDDGTDEEDDIVEEVNEKMENLDCKDNDRDEFAKGYAYIRSKLTSSEVIEVLSTNGMLASIRVCYDWLRSDPEVLRKCARSATALIKRTCRLINLINVDVMELLEGMKKSPASQQSSCWELYSEVEKAIQFAYAMPLPEDEELRGISMFSGAQEGLDWVRCSKRKMSPQEESLIRVMKLVSFGEHLSYVKDYTGVVYDEANHVFRVLETDLSVEEMEEEVEEEDVADDILAANDLVEHMNDIANNMAEQVANTDGVIKCIMTEPVGGLEKREKSPELVVKESKPKIENKIENKIEEDKGKLMRSMGTLWLQAEVEALENRLHSKLMPPFLVPDHEVLVKFMPVLKKLVYSKKFVVVIPSIVVSTLDDMKRSSAQAREATRWLENELERGSRFLKAQRPNERLPLPLIKAPKPKDRESWTYFQIIECCHYLTQKTNITFQSDCAELPVVTLLTGFNNQNNEAMRASIAYAEILAKSAGVNIEHIQVFHTKWKASSKSHG